jgi:hypothetical protein
MELLMEIKLNTLLLLIVTFSACGRGNPAPLAAPLVETASVTAGQRVVQRTDFANTNNSLEEIAELERAGSWFAGMALAESGLRENAGDYAGAVAAAYKELAWAYGRGTIQKQDTEKGLLNVLALQSDAGITAAADAVLAFSREQWTEAFAALRSLFDEAQEPDGFGRWMLLVCALETNREDRLAAAAYKAIRARYAHFPEYWYRGARAFSGLIAAEYAENCINAAPQGPFAPECRDKLASHNGLKTEDGSSLKTKTEIETIISQSLNTGNPELLDSLFPLVSLPDNPYTIYAVNALRSLTAAQKYRDYLKGQAASSKGRLAERLLYICRA